MLFKQGEMALAIMHHCSENVPEKRACSLNLGSLLTSCMTNHNIATRSKHPLSRRAGRGDMEVVFFFWPTCKPCGELTLCSFHHRGPVSVSAAGVCEELFGSALIAAVTHSLKFISFFFFFYLEKFSEFFFLSISLLFLHLLQQLQEKTQREL